MTYKVGIIGLGMIGESMLQEFTAHPQFTVGAVWDCNEQINAQIANRYPFVTIAKDALAIIESTNLDLVYIATPPLTHIDYCYQVIDAHKALLCDKPLAINLELARQLVEKAEAQGTIAAMNFIYGAGGIVETIEKQLEGGTLGALQNIEIRYQFPSWPLPNQLSAASWITKRQQGGMVREMLSHFVYLIQRLFGEVVVKSAELHYPKCVDAAEDFILANLETAQMPVWVMGGIGGVAAPRESELTIHGSNGSLRLSNLFNVAITDEGQWRQLQIGRASPAAEQARLSALARRMEGKPTRLPDLRAGLAVQQVIETILSGNQHA